MDGYIKLHRKILENPIVCKDSDYFAIWSYLLLNATHKEYQSLFKGEKVILQPGQLITGRKVISTKFNISESKVQRVLKKLENEQQIEQQTSNENRLITIVQWHEYQTSEQQIEQPVNNERTTDEQPVNTNKNVKNVKNDKNKRNKEDVPVNKSKKATSPISIQIYHDNEQVNQAILDFISFRKEIKKPMTERAIDLLVKKVNKMSSIPQEQVDIINQSIFKNWTDLYDLKEEFRTKGKEKDNEPRTVPGTSELSLAERRIKEGNVSAVVESNPFGT